MLLIIEIIAGLILLGVVAVAVFIAMQPKHKFIFDVAKRTKAELAAKTEDKLCFNVDVPFSNEGGDEGLVLDAFMRIYLPQEQYDKALVRGKINLKDVPRDDDYFEAMVMPKGEHKTITRTYLIKALGKNVLVDSGWGTESGIDGKTVEYLAMYGVPAEKVTDILLTHMDVDHISGLINGGKAVYPKAILHIADKEYNRWVVMGADREPEFIALARRVAKAYEGRIALFDYDDEVVPGITARNANGHTMGHTCYDIVSGDKALTIVGDMIHVAPIQMRYTDYCSVYDVSPALAAATRERVLHELSQSGRLIAGMHFPEIGRVQQNDDGGYTVVSSENF